VGGDEGVLVGEGRGVDVAVGVLVLVGVDVAVFFRDTVAVAVIGVLTVGWAVLVTVGGTAPPEGDSWNSAAE